MLRRNLFLALSLALAMVLPAVAGEKGKCKLSTQDCLNAYAAKLKNSGFVGIEMDKDEETGILTIERVIPGSPAEESGLRPGDQLYALNGVVFAEKNEKKLEKAYGDWAPGQEITYTVKRGGYEKEIELTLGSMPADVMAKWIGSHMLEHASETTASAK